jgi:diguanylate cyclase (GGDEF)-like protein
MTRAIWVSVGIMAGAVVVLLVTVGVLLRRLRRTSAALVESRHHDPLTHLPNRRLLTDRLTMAIAQAKRSPSHGAVMFIDLDHFKVVNDSHGHAVGDRLLLAVAERLRRGVRLSDTVARFGGDEFVILFPALDPEPFRAREVAEGLAQKLLDRLAEAHQLSGPDARGSAPSVVHRCSGSIGIALFDGTSDVAETLQAADRAMYRAKEHGRNRFALAER